MTRLTAVVSTHQRRAMVERLLGALTAQRLTGHELEIVVVADGCTDGTVEAVAAWRAAVDIRVVAQAQSGLAAARNRGAAEARGDVILFCDDDVVPGPGFVRAICDELERGADVVLPFVRVADWVPDGLLAREQRAWDAHVARAMRDGALSVDHVHFIATAVRRECFVQLGGFDAAFTHGGAWGKEDTEFAYRLFVAGARIVCRPDLVLESDCVTAPRTALRRGRDLGRNDVRLARKHPALADVLFREQFAGARIIPTMGRLLVSAPRSAQVLASLARPLVVRAIERGWAGGLLYRLWLVVWAAEWWGGVLDAGGRDFASEHRRSLG